MKWIATRLGRLTLRQRLVLQAVLGSLLSYYLAILSVQVADVLSFHNWTLFLFHMIISISVLLVLAIVISTIAQAIEIYVEKRRIVMGTANTQLRRATVEEAQAFSRQMFLPTAERRLVPHTAEESIRLLVNGVYNTLEAHYSEASIPGESISFESTFMTRSLEDGEITVYAWANREGRMPASLRERARNPRIYERSVTADIYRSAVSERPVARLIEDTRAPGESYEELYPGQKTRILCSIVYPVMSPSSDLLGTLVVHCNRARFFRHEDFGYWTELLETFAARIALEKLRLDNTVVCRELLDR